MFYCYVVLNYVCKCSLDLEVSQQAMTWIYVDIGSKDLASFSRGQYVIQKSITTHECYRHVNACSL